MKSKSDPDAAKKSQGQLTAEIGKSLRFEGYDVLYDHDVSSETVGRIVSYFGEENQRGTQLSYVDIAIVKKNTNEVIVLVEIEETANRPKTIIADVFGLLLGENLAFQGQALRVSRETIFIVFGLGTGRDPKHKQYIQDQVEAAKSALRTENSKVGQVIIETFVDKGDLLTHLTTLVDKAIKGTS